jgi:hypothetical protein
MPIVLGVRLRFGTHFSAELHRFRKVLMPVWFDEGILSEKSLDRYLEIAYIC